MCKLRVLQLYVLLQRTLRSVVTLAEGHLAFELFLNLLSSPTGSLPLALVRLLLLLKISMS